MNKKKPLVSYILLSYNQSKYIYEAVESALNQDYSNVELIISDDCSTDDTFSKIESLCMSSKRKTSVNRNKVNQGLSKHFSQCLERSCGEIIVVAAGDDVSFLDRVSRVVDYFHNDSSISMISFNDLVFSSDSSVKRKMYNINEDISFDLDDYINFRNVFSSGASRAFRRQVFLEFGPLNADCPTEDTPYLLRGLMAGKVLFSKDPGIYYRVHGNNLSSSESLKKMNIKNIFKQHSQDLELAQEKRLLTSSKVKEIKSWLDHSFQIRSISQIDGRIRKLIHRLQFLARSKVYRKAFLMTLIEMYRR
jgi:glycosyltransferase involved in cell wall biosynthesis